MTLQDLEQAVSDYPEYLNRRRLRRYQRRLERGEVGYGAYSDGKLVHLAWLGQCDEVTAAYEAGPGCRLPLDETALLIRDCWTPKPFRGRGIYRAVLTQLVARAAEQGKAAWICCEARNLSSRSCIETVGFGLQARFHRIQWLGIIRRSWVEHASSHPGLQG